MDYTAEVKQYRIWDDTAEDRVWEGTITNGDLTFLFQQNDYGLRRTGEGDDADLVLPTRLRLYTPQRRLVPWSKTKSADQIRKAVHDAIIKAQALYRPVLYANDDPTGCLVTIEADSIVYKDGYGTITYQRRTDGSADLGNGSATPRTVCEPTADQMCTG